MPRKLRRTKTRMTVPLTLAMTDFLLGGRTRSPDDVPADERDSYDCFLEFDDWTPEKLEAAWAVHGDALEAERRRRAVERAPQ